MDAVIGVRLVICIMISTVLAMPLYFCIVPLDGDYSDTEVVEYSHVVHVSVDVPADSKWPTLPKLYTPMLERYVMPEDPSVRQVSDALKAHAEKWGYDDRRTVNLVKRWVAYNISYVSDPEAHGWPDYWQTPFQTLRLGTGDCEDFAVLFSSICGALGYETVFVSEPGHISSGVLLEPRYDDVTVSFGGKRYVALDAQTATSIGREEPETLAVYPAYMGSVAYAILAVDVLVVAMSMYVMRKVMF